MAWPILEKSTGEVGSLNAARLTLDRDMDVVLELFHLNEGGARCPRLPWAILAHPLLVDPCLFDGLEEFRQHIGGELLLTMLQNIGEPIDVREIDHAAMRQAIAEVQSFAGG